MSNEKKDFVSEISVSYSRTYKRKIKVTGADSAHKTLRKMWDTNLLNIQEQFCVLFLNNSNEVVGFRCLSSGTLTASLVDFKILFGLACKSLSSAIIIAHNHPSGKLQPSQGDINVTKKIKEAGNMLDIKLLDHIILTQNDYYSLNDNHLI
ncbi:JAB domain-containing protein [Tenacibaculum mesophilum]|uniref:JAB domain-containing protein n=1 Tax=Tenacibaculum mesophilum TaxID=104268 RepID=UPI002492FD16|nr:JAB domain-containing protein [Tenacibaculum mesophilum]